MEILLVYAIVGICTAPWILRGEKRIDGIECEDVWDVICSYALLTALWPAAVIAFPYGWRKTRLAREVRQAEEYEALLERVRREIRTQTQRDFAEFDKELGIEPAWKKAHPHAAMEWENIYEDWERRRSLPNYSKGGRL